MSKKQPRGYPVQQPAYPTQPAYPPQAGYPTQHIPGGYPTQPVPGGYPAQPYQQPTYNPQYPQHPQPYPQVPYTQPGYGQPPPPYPGTTPNPVPQQQPSLAHGQFDSGARFGAGSSVNIPPPPPGVMPTHAQMAAATGQSVVMKQQKTGWVEGAQGGGYTFW
ncbi:annexin A7-like isoform X2 [Dendronephthya gigantea]|uniref:annexin A7-like isoform X2 n=1 Tax=Dendronephthya gigantea TaxID=151771 RepID=UPI0010692B77|nr:annexin A7-like isoform X2 [Dendronephthya gigantea]